MPPDHYSVVPADQVPTTEYDDSVWNGSELASDDLGEALGTERARVKIWRFPPGDEMGFHTHDTQEEIYYVLEGTFEVKIGPPGDIETHTVEAGGAFAAQPSIGRGYRNVGDEEGVVLTVASPDVDDPGQRPTIYHGRLLFDEE